MGRRESERSESDRDDALHSVPEAEETRENKRRRIAPVPVPLGAESDSAIASTEENTSTAQTSVQQ
jgi:chromatin assembly factor 1 subunit B